ncbi:hypothetical protein M427DRAFT_58968 [Gonapodya prolifera JEL478]|uniref:ABM domain-containing protein n=1 Tax=Gonapodya prolifera (strain JEL478) TaxID=1344416 RepID=A0A139A8L8_GONPJ|nr:hypothetical protein M427DRAFT_58968 [Gonapodya prolifera JEL478]|eukprot:KXS13054.1 hypothetical protein M427DRAFT_58968 [Gonapodya prolifera JEL478]
MSNANTVNILTVPRNNLETLLARVREMNKAITVIKGFKGGKILVRDGVNNTDTVRVIIAIEWESKEAFHAAKDEFKGWMGEKSELESQGVTMDGGMYLGESF